MSLRRLHPPLHLLRAFSTVVRYGGISRAAEALHLTQSAVTKQVQELERWLGVPLFERSRKRLVPTPAGERYERAVAGLLGRLEEATLALITDSEGGGALQISVLPTFLAKWLIPRLPQLRLQHPQITLDFVPHRQGYDFSDPSLDCSILFGEGHWPGARAHYLAGRDVALIAPRRALGGPRIDSPADVAGCTRLRHVSVPSGWQQWADAHQLTGLATLAGPQFDQFQTMIRAVAVGMGVALVPRCLVQDEIAAGTVEEPLPDGGYLCQMGYWLCYPQARTQLDKLVRLKDWLLTQAE